jgi:hypothetical protein
MTDEITPLTFITAWDFLLVVLSATVRLFVVLKYKALSLSKKKRSFEIVKYFDQKHIIRWVGHYLTAFVLLLVLPEIFLAFLGPKYFPEFAAWSFTGDFILGFLGYDLIKLLEGLAMPLIKKRLKK